MLKKLDKLILSLVMIMSLVCGGMTTINATSQDDMRTIKGRLKEYFLELDTIDDGSKVETCYVSKAQEYLNLIRDDGSFDDVDYKANNNAANGAAWSPYLALDRLQAIAIAYHQIGNPLYQQDRVVDKLNSAIKYWHSQNPSSKNWWENEVGVQLRFSRIALFMEGIVSDEVQEIMLNKLLQKKPVKYGTGQNNLWFDQNYVYHALISEDATELKTMVTDYLDYCLSAQLDKKTAEAVQVDNSFYMHGQQFYSNGYGMSMFRDMSFWIYMLRDTEFAISQEVVDRMADYMLDGTSWTIRGDIMELYLGYRPYKFDVGYTNYAKEYIIPLKRMIVSDPDRASRYQAILANIEGKTTSNGKDGNYYMWRSGYASHMKDGYGVNIKMDSKNIIGGEWRGSWPAGQNQGQLIYWTSSAASTITVDGDEYTNVFPTYDWAHCPGTTTANRIVADYSNSGRFTNGTDHTIGVSNGKYGSTAYVMDKKDTQATKGYFFFDDEFVALGSGITSKEAVAIHTTLNQSEADNVIVGNETVTEGTKAKSYTTNWLYNDKVGYVFPKEKSVLISNTKQTENPSLWDKEQKDKTPATFSAWIDHGIKPQNDSYEYIVIPNKTAKEVGSYANNIPVTIVSNTKEIQAVRHDGLKQTQINFYKGGSLEYKPGHVITVDQPCSIIIDESSDTRKLTVALNDQNEHKTVNVQLDYQNSKTTTTFVSKAVPYAGQSMTALEGQDDRYQASSAVLSHPVNYVVDQKNDTYWQSEGKDEEWISVFAGANKYIKDINILWGNNYAKQYDVYASSNGIDYEKIKSVDSGKGKQEAISIGGIYGYIKLVMKSSSANNYQIKELAINDGELLSLNKPTITSSVSSNAPTFTGDLAVDGNLGTRWASSRNSDKEWITIDLQKESRIDAVSINWENACSDDYTVDVSSDNQTWTTVKQLKTDLSLIDEINFEKSVYGRYVRINSNKSRLVSGTNYGINIFEINIYGESKQNIPEPQQVNIALNKESKASSEFLDTKDGNKIYHSSLAFDGSTSKINNQQSRWVSNRQSNDEWIYVDLENNYDINKVVLNWEGACGKEYKVQISQDGNEWNDLTHITDGKPGIIELIYDQPMSGRYVRMLGITPATEYGYSLWEFEVYGELSKEPEPESVNIALNKESKASSEFLDTKDGNKVYYSSLAFDGSTDKVNNQQSRWVSNRQSNDEWIYVDLGENYYVSKVALNWEGACGKEYKVQISQDGNEWNDLTHITDGKPGIIELTYDQPMSGRYVRMLGITPATKYGYSLWEFEVYGNSLKAELKDYYDQNKDIDTSNYTPKSAAQYNEALENMLNVYQNKDATVIQIMEAKEKLKTAIESFVLKANKDVLENEINQAENIDKELYTSGSLEAFKTILDAAKEIYDDKNVTQANVDKQVELLQQAYNLLELKPSDTYTTVVSANQDVKISGILPENLELAVRILDTLQLNNYTDLINQIDSTLLKEAVVAKVYDLNLEINGDSHLLNDYVEVSIKLDDQLLNKNLNIINIDNDKVNIIESKIENGYIIFKVNSLGQYGIIFENKQTDGEVVEIVDTPKTDVIESVETGDNSLLSLTAGTLFISALGLIVFRKKK